MVSNWKASIWDETHTTVYNIKYGCWTLKERQKCHYWSTWIIKQLYSKAQIYVLNLPSI